MMRMKPENWMNEKGWETSPFFLPHRKLHKGSGEKSEICERCSEDDCQKRRMQQEDD